MKNILILFLSDVKTNNGLISETRYENVDGEKTQTTNESAFRYLLKNFPLDKIFIFASKKVRGEIVGYLGEDGKPRTHLQFSLERFRKFMPELKCFVFDYNEYGSDNDNLKSIAEMAERVQKFAEGEKVTLHVDLTGGMRHVNMMMLELTRLLEYSGMTVGKVLYSNYKGQKTPSTVEEIQNVYDLFQLISGVEEFVNFGSVKALKLYYADKKISKPLENLRDAMENFAEAIKLCHYGQFQESIENLHDAIHDFNEHELEDVEDILMARLVGRIHKNYQELIENRYKDDLRVIRWCLDNDYLQQALTLYTERIPEYLGEKRIITQNETESKRMLELIAKNKKKIKENTKLNPWFYMFSDLNPAEKKLENGKEIFCKAVKSAAKQIIAKESSFNYGEWLAALNKELAPLELNCDDKEEFRAQFETLFKVFKDPRILSDLSSTELEPISKLLDNLPDKMEEKFKSAKYGGQRCKILAEFFNNKLTVDTVPEYFIGTSFMKYPKAIKMHELLNEKIYSVNIPQENFLSIVDRYFRIKDERNHSNHAREDYGEFKTAERLREVMSEGIKEIQNNLPIQSIFPELHKAKS